MNAAIDVEAVPQLPDSFHPAVAEWFARAFPRGPTPTQVRAWAVTAGGGDALVCAPTGSGKTLAAFLAAINELIERGLQAPLPDTVQVLYVSPLKALSNDIEHNLRAPLNGIRDRLFELGLGDVGIRSAVRTGDTTASERALMRRLPPHILVTTPESLFILLGSESGRTMLAGVRALIVDELHALAGSKRGAHLMLSLERLVALCPRPPVRIGLSATVKPIETVASYLVGGCATSLSRRLDQVNQSGDSGSTITVADSAGACSIIDAGHARARDLALEVPHSALDSVMSNEVWTEVYDRLAELAQQHRTTLIFVNQRRIAERVARHLAERLGVEHVTAHHGSLAKEHRLHAEQRLKAGRLKALVATSSLELGIDIGDVDLVCQLGSPRWISALLQRVGRAGHAVGAVSKGRLFPLTLDDLVECTALLDAVRRGELDRIRDPGAPLDVLAQQIVAEVGSREWQQDDLFTLVRRAAPYRSLERADFDAVVAMLAEGYATRRGRRGAYLHHDTIQRRLRPRRGARLVAATNAGVIPDQFDCDVILQPQGLRIGSLNEDFAFESVPGDIFQLGNTAYRIVKVETGRVLVEDAKGQPPSLPFWLGEALGRSDELSFAVSRLLTAVEAELEVVGEGDTGVAEAHPGQTASEGERAANGGESDRYGSSSAAQARARGLDAIPGVPVSAWQQLRQYLGAARAALGVLPTLERIVVERFFDEVGDSHLVIHSPYGSRINKAWGLALRKRFCRQFNFELQASALEDSIVLSLGPTHSFPLEDVTKFLHSATARAVLVQALLDVPMFPTRFRWNASIALAVRRMNGGKRVPPQFQRSDAEDLLTVVFPDQVACLENLSGPREIPEHPLVVQTLHDCLHDTMDVEGFLALLARIESGAVRVHCRDLTTPSPLATAILNARPYAFLDDGEAEERRTRAVATQRLHEIDAGANPGQITAQAIASVRAEVWPLVRDADELHDALVVHGFLAGDEIDRLGRPWLDALIDQGRAVSVSTAAGECAVAIERLPQWRCALPESKVNAVNVNTRRAQDVPGIPEADDCPLEPDGALRELLRGRLELLGPVAEDELVAALAVEPTWVRRALLLLEGEGTAMRVRADAVTVDDAETWCDRRLLARIHRLSREHRRAAVRPVPPAQFLRFLVHWHGLLGIPDAGAATAADSALKSDRHPSPDPGDVGQDPRRQGESALLAVLQQLEGWVAPAAAWERDLLPQRLRDYTPAMLDRLCASGRIVWWRPVNAEAEISSRRSGPVRGTPILFAERSHLRHWQTLASAGSPMVDTDRRRPSGIDAGEGPMLSGKARRVRDSLRDCGALFFSDLEHECGLIRSELEPALAELVAQGVVGCDSFAGLRALIAPAKQRLRQRGRALPVDADHAGRWSLLRSRRRPASDAGERADGALAEPSIEHAARMLLRRYGVVFRAMLAREQYLPPWRSLHYVYRRLEARGEIRGGRFVDGFAGEQFALPEAAAALRAAAVESEALVAVSAADPLNLAGILVPGGKLPALTGNRLLLRDGVPIAARAGRQVELLQDLTPAEAWRARTALVRRPASPSAQPPV